MAEMLGANDPFRIPPEDFLNPTLPLPDAGTQPEKESLDPVAARRALNFITTTLGLAFVFVGSMFLWNWQVACIVIGTYLLLRGAIPRTTHKD